MITIIIIDNSRVLKVQSHPSRILFGIELLGLEAQDGWRGMKRKHIKKS